MVKNILEWKILRHFGLKELFDKKGAAEVVFWVATLLIDN
jgi:hypothetical protein